MRCPSTYLVSQRTWEFVSYEYCRDVHTGLSVSGDLQSFFYVLLYISVLLLRNNVIDSEGYCDTFFRTFTLPGQGPYRTYISNFKADTLFDGILGTDPKSCMFLVFYGLDVYSGRAVRTPLNGLLNNFLWLIHASYCAFQRSLSSNLPQSIKMTPRPPERHGVYYNPFSRQPPPQDGVLVEARELARKLWDHKAVLEMFDDALKKPWSMDDWNIPPEPAVGVRQQ